MNTWYLVLAGVWVWCSTFRVWVRTKAIPLNALHCSNGISCDGGWWTGTFWALLRSGPGPVSTIIDAHDRSRSLLDRTGMAGSV